MSRQLYRLGYACFGARRRVIAAWLLLLVLIGALVGVAGTHLDEGFTIPGTPAQNALDDLERTLPQSAGGAAQIVVHSQNGTVTDGAVQDDVLTALTRVSALEGVASVSNPYTGAPVVPPGVEMPALPPTPDVVETSRVSGDGSTLYSQVQFDDEAQYVSDDLKDQVVADFDGLSGVETSFGGPVFQSSGAHISIVDVAGVLVALIVLAATFRSVVAAFLPIGTTLLGVAVAIGGVLLVSNVISVSSSAPTLGSMIGLAVGIDYALFIVSRYRELLGEGHDPREAAGRAIATAGSAVVFAGATVVIALLGLSIARIPFLTVMGAGAAFAVVIAVAIALTLLPALLGTTGTRLHPAPAAAQKQPVARRWSAFTQRFRWVITVGAVALLLICALPVGDLRLALPDGGDQDAGTSQRIAYDTIAREFGPGYNGALTVSASLPSPTEAGATIDQLANDLAGMPGVQAVTVATPNETADTAVFSVVPQWSADAQETKDLTGELRDRAATDSGWADYDIAVTGPTAVSLDVSDRLAGALLPFGAVVVGLSLILLMLVFRSLLVPLTASIGYVLSTLASFGAVAAVFEWGWLADAIGVDHTGPVISFLPIMLMGVLFGLAMDYQVFLVSRMRERHTQGGSAKDSVDQGFRQSSRVVVAAAVIMVAVFAAFVPTGDSVLKPIAFALAAGVALDAFVVRLTLIPAVMTLLGDRAWMLPGWLDRHLPEFDVEGAALDRPGSEDAEPDEDRVPTVS